uniref:Uncharacterized protein n=1 Tax=Cucumis melo TaxID=3656 RepID=A0A9I9CFP4_CUCME
MARFDAVVKLSAVGRHDDRRTDVRWQGEVSTLGLPSTEEDEGKGNGKGKRNGKWQERW